MQNWLFANQTNIFSPGATTYIYKFLEIIKLVNKRSNLKRTNTSIKKRVLIAFFKFPSQ